MNFWQGQKVCLRAVEPEDAAIFARWNQDSERARFLDFLWPPSSLAAVRDWAEEQSRRKLEKDAFHWVIENIEGEPVGSISTHDCNARAGTFSYGVDIAPDNPASIRLHEELGFQKEGTLRRMVFTHGEFVDALWYGLTREEFKKMVNG